MSSEPPTQTPLTNPNDAATPPSRRRYSDEFKQDAVRLVVEEKYSFQAAAKAVNVSEHSLRK